MFSNTFSASKKPLVKSHDEIQACHAQWCNAINFYYNLQIGMKKGPKP